MKEEIKELVVDDGELIAYYKDGSFQAFDTLLQEVLDYITNLQEENERLKEENKHIFSKVNDDELLISNAMNYAEAQDYKSRNEKAIEYIEKNNHIDGCLIKWEVADLLQILKGENK